jgi:hypothetical protein
MHMHEEGAQRREEEDGRRQEGEEDGGGVWSRERDHRFVKSQDMLGVVLAGLLLS